MEYMLLESANNSLEMSNNLQKAIVACGVIIVVCLIITTAKKILSGWVANEKEVEKEPTKKDEKVSYAEFGGQLTKKFAFNEAEIVPVEKPVAVVEPVVSEVSLEEVSKKENKKKEEIKKQGEKAQDYVNSRAAMFGTRKNNGHNVYPHPNVKKQEDEDGTPTKDETKTDKTDAKSKVEDKSPKSTKSTNKKGTKNGSGKGKSNTNSNSKPKNTNAHKKDTPKTTTSSNTGAKVVLESAMCEEDEFMSKFGC